MLKTAFEAVILVTGLLLERIIGEAWGFLRLWSLLASLSLVGLITTAFVARRAWMRIVQIILLAAAFISACSCYDWRSDVIRASSSAPQFHGYFYRG